MRISVNFERYFEWGWWDAGGRQKAVHERQEEITVTGDQMEHSQPHWQVRAYLQWQESERMTSHSLQGRKGLSTAIPLMSLVARLHQMHVIRPGQMMLCGACQPLLHQVLSQSAMYWPEHAGICVSHRVSCAGVTGLSWGSHPHQSCSWSGSPPPSSR